MSEVTIQTNTKEEVAFKVLTKITYGKKYTKDEILDLYVECLEATSGNRRVEKE